MSFTKITNAGFGLTTGTLVGVAASFSSTVSVGGTLTYEDVTNVDSVGLITARNGIEVTDKGVQVGTGATVDSSAANTLTFLTGGSERLSIGSNGRVNIGQASSSDHTLCVAAEDDTTSLTGGHNQGIQLQNKSTTDGTYSQIEWRTAAGGRYARIAGIQDDANGNGGQLVFLTETSGGSTAEALRITSAGNIGIGTISPLRALQVGSHGSGNGEIALASADDGNCSILMGDGATGTDFYRGYIQYQNNADSLVFATSTEARLRIDSSGRLLLGTTTPGDSSADDLTISTSGHSGISIKSGTSHAGGIYFGDGTSGSSQYEGIIQYSHSVNALQFYTNYSGSSDTRMTIDSNGRLLLGSTSTQGSTPSTMQIKGAGGTAIGVTLISGNDENAGGLLLDSSGTNSLRIDADPDDNRNDTYIRFATDGTTRARIDSHGIKFGSDTAQANALDDYEEGTWTPTIAFGGGNTGMTFQHSPYGTYTKIGDTVRVRFGFRFSNKGTSTGAFVIDNLPFSGSSTSYNHSANAVMVLDAAADKTATALVTGGTKINLRTRTDTNSATTDSYFYNNTSVFGTIVYDT